MSEAVLKAVLRKIDHRFLDEVSKVDTGCYALFGALWIRFNKDTEWLALTLRYSNLWCWWQETRMSSSPPAIIKSTLWQQQENTTLPLGSHKLHPLQICYFLTNVRKIQDNPAPRPDRKGVHAIFVTASLHLAVWKFVRLGFCPRDIVKNVEEGLVLNHRSDEDPPFTIKLTNFPVPKRSDAVTKNEGRELLPMLFSPNRFIENHREFLTEDLNQYMEVRSSLVYISVRHGV
ncbi:hypothetical protein DFH07DRAFT_770745 [Mycena maculata]|uniref:Uncharacterized protein n=1 Tax=Mycena maculata TaxID=230809 RepID=A0AAD7NK02_9AGAR|nr:hypothetical protein DFH07DRAFT_770745 [Mycena maculata]